MLLYSESSPSPKHTHTVSLLPTSYRAIDELLEMMGAHTGMDLFVGHKEN